MLSPGKKYTVREELEILKHCMAQLAFVISAKYPECEEWCGLVRDKLDQVGRLYYPLGLGEKMYNELKVVEEKEEDEGEAGDRPW